jgi:hypothetical protein
MTMSAQKVHDIRVIEVCLERRKRRKNGSCIGSLVLVGAQKILTLAIQIIVVRIIIVAVYGAVMIYGSCIMSSGQVIKLHDINAMCKK